MAGQLKVRFAPSPTGLLHVGNARLALVNWLFARHGGGTFLLRLDDTDVDRSDARYGAAIEGDLGWLGLHWDEFARQSDRLARYAAAIERLKAAGRLYPCYETPEELSLKRKQQLSQGRPPVYDRAALSLGDSDRARLERDGRRPHWRFLLEERAVAWHDLARGPVRFEPGHMSDPVLVREDGHPLYTLSSVVDDGELGITHVVRGEDHVANTAVQIQLFEALAFVVPAFAHLPLLMGDDGKPLSKRLESLSIKALRDDGIEAGALCAYLAHLGTPTSASGAESMEDLVAGFDIAAFGRAAPRFDRSELEHLNMRLLHRLPFDAVRERLGLEGADEAFWAAVRPNLTRLEDARIWWRILHGDVEPVISDAALCRTAAALLPDEPWDETTFKSWAEAVGKATGAKGKALFMPLRQALTGMDHGPELRVLLPMLGRERALARLTSATPTKAGS
ncbi:MAG: glutamate--tRNA ligase [Rhodospirillales bacterium]|nr:MAG: glutamate--tRNA ligase [Rhodospirillales bacterium]